MSFLSGLWRDFSSTRHFLALLIVLAVASAAYGFYRLAKGAVEDQADEPVRLSSRGIDVLAARTAEDAVAYSEREWARIANARLADEIAAGRPALERPAAPAPAPGELWRLRRSLGAHDMPPGLVDPDGPTDLGGETP